MPRRGQAVAEPAARRSRRESSQAVSYLEQLEDRMDVNDDSDERPSISENSTSDEVDEELEADDDGVSVNGRLPLPNRRAKNAPPAAASADNNEDGRRMSKRVNRFTSSMAEPDQSIKDLLQGSSGRIRANVMQKSRSHESTDLDDTASEDETRAPNRKTVKGTDRRDSLVSIGGSPSKSPARRHTKPRLSFALATMDTDEESDDSFLETETEDAEPTKIQRILASRTETRRRWQEICKDINTSEVECGSRWFQQPRNGAFNGREDEVTFEERFFVKWAELSYLHCSWETQVDLIEQVEGAKNYLTTFFRRSENGILFSQDERCDGDYYNPAYIQIDRILEVEFPDGVASTAAADEDALQPDAMGIILDKGNPHFEEGTGRQLLIKWGDTSYSESTYEFERDLIFNDVEYKQPLKEFLARSRKPTAKELRGSHRAAQEEFRRLEKTFREESELSEVQRTKAIKKYQAELQERVYDNGGQLRDYQAEGVSWILSNYVNDRSCVLADEMGLGKTLQTAATVNILSTMLDHAGVYLIVAPLSTISHWKREFHAWTDLNVIVYHGSADDREHIRNHEMAYECNRPKSVGFNQQYLRKCIPKKPAKGESPWMVDVVITTPEMLIADDAVELAAVKWSCLVVDEAHRLKNHNSKLALTMRDVRFTFEFKILLTGTPIQNSVVEFYTLLNFIDPDAFGDSDCFLNKFGDMKSKDRVDELHEEIRPYILRRLKEDVEKSVPPKEETLIEVELTLSQKQYYRALYEKNVTFLCKNKKKALDGPSLSNLAMQLRKCCNHLFLLNGVEEEFRDKLAEKIDEGDFLVRGSGKLVLLDKLLPRLQQEGHRVLVFSQFKIMLDILEDYLNVRKMKFERIDGSITGHKRQQAIDRFQQASTAEREAPFIMMLSTRAGGVGINLTAADTCIIFDSDWNPQNDLQAQARCHRIGQSKSVKIYRLLTRKTYEMHMFHMSSMKMGLDQAVLRGFESGASGEALSKEEVERLLKHGAYDIFNEEKAGSSEAESNEFIQQDIDSILQRRSRTVIQANTGSGSQAAGGTFSKASFKARTPTKSTVEGDDIDVDDPDFWKKIVGDPVEDADEAVSVPRQRAQKNYSEQAYTKDLNALIRLSDGSDSDEDDMSSDATIDGDLSEKSERLHWGGSGPFEWKKDSAELMTKLLQTFGYACVGWDKFLNHFNGGKDLDTLEAKRMCWAIMLFAFLEISSDDAAAAARRGLKASEKLVGDSATRNSDTGGMLVFSDMASTPSEDSLEQAFAQLWLSHSNWASELLKDAAAYAAVKEPRNIKVFDKWRLKQSSPANSNYGAFASNLWPSLKTRGWKTEQSGGDGIFTVAYCYDGKKYATLIEVLDAAKLLHPELSNAVDMILELFKTTRRESIEELERERTEHLSLCQANIGRKKLMAFLEKYAPLQLVIDRKKSQPLRLPRRLLSVASVLSMAVELAQRAGRSMPANGVDSLSLVLFLDKRTPLPHPLWTTHHDAVLIRSILKHGWIDNDSSCRAITEDPEVLFGPPFDSLNKQYKPMAQSGESRAVDLWSTAERAATILNVYRDAIRATKGAFDADLLVRTYCLDCITGIDDSECNKLGHVAALPVFVPNESKVKGAAVSKATGPQDLPPKKDLVKRAKAVITRSFQNDDAAAATGISPHTESRLVYTLLDQRDPCNILLAQLMSSVVKVSSSSIFSKKLCSLAVEEATARLQAMDGAATEDAVAEMRSILQFLKLVQQQIAKSTMQAKNVLRVMLGQDPQPPRNPNESMFLSEKVQLRLLETAKVAKTKRSPRTARSKAQAKSLGLQTIEVALMAQSDRGSKKNVIGSQRASIVELTEVETLVLCTVSTYGIPVWSDNWQSLLINESTNLKGNGHVIDWTFLCGALTRLATEQLMKAISKLQVYKREYNRISTDPKKLDERADTEHAIWIAERVRERKKEALEQAKDYASDCEALAKKVIVMLAKVQAHFRPIAVNGEGVSDENGAGESVLTWLDSDITKWALSFDLVDDSGRPLGATAVDFLDEIPENERPNIEVVASLNAENCHVVMSQIAMLSRARSILTKRIPEEALERIRCVVDTMKTHQERSELEPVTWRPVAQDDILLQRLVDSGIEDVSTDVNSYGRSEEFAKVSFRHLGFTQLAVQLRANKLVRELHILEETRGSESLWMERNLRPASSEAKKVQKGLLQYFESASVESTPRSLAQQANQASSPAKGNSRDAALEITDSPSSVAYSDVEVVSPLTGKRKDDRKTPDIESPASAEKKPRAA